MTAVKDIIEFLVQENDTSFYCRTTLKVIRDLMDEEEYDGDELKVNDADELFSIIDDMFKDILRTYLFGEEDEDEEDEELSTNIEAVVEQTSEETMNRLFPLANTMFNYGGDADIAYTIIEDAWYKGTWRQATLSNIKHTIHSKREKNFVWKQLD